MSSVHLCVLGASSPMPSGETEHDKARRRTSKSRNAVRPAVTKAPPADKYIAGSHALRQLNHLTQQKRL
jgi:hypothetical protein